MLPKKEAAAFANISERTLERYTRQGRIAATYHKGRTRNVLMYDEKALSDLKESRESTQRPRASTAVSEPAEVINFRLPPHYARRLAKEGTQHGMSTGMYARHLVIDALENAEQVRLQTDIAALRRLVVALGQDLATGVLALLLQAGKIEDEAEARAWVQENFRVIRQSVSEPE